MLRKNTEVVGESVREAVRCIAVMDMGLPRSTGGIHRNENLIYIQSG